MKRKENPREGDLEVWHIPQIPGKAFRVPVDTVYEGAKLMEIFAQYDLFQYEERVKPDYCNASGLDIFEDGEWLSVDDYEIEEAVEAGI